jgi:VanZ family protein
MAFIFAVSSLSMPPAVTAIPDWTTHGAGYLILSVLTCRALAGGLGPALSRRDAVLAVLVSTAYGISDELHQSFVPGRQSDAMDVAKDLAGAVVGAWLYRRASAPRGALGETQRG